ncbi:Alpha/Beta hydrolase protein [Suillus subalutaceus]|uniref:Alpha/Beta hydrolase protein n=1 Tax=Suillus subalutaceus TaxID=48586 RepID=UPI001B85D9B4|nr:Alpha/Beta hydrolase protein [Suillus subalutaceus]KAG1840929.1 Alpha/Beta hydrolase protein [Suillus subalutaceus]
MHWSTYLVLPFSLSFVVGAVAFNARAYTIQSTSCKAVDRVLDEEVNITIDYVDVNPTAEKSIIMIEEFKDEYRMIAIDSSSTLADITGDLTCVLEHVGIQSAICLGHDWGAEVCYEAARRRPDIFYALVGVTVPYLHAAGPFADSAQLAAVMPKLAYQVFFENHTTEAVAELNKDIRRSLRATLRTVNSAPPDSFLTSTSNYLSAYDNIPPIPFFTSSDEEYFVERFSIQKFDHTLIFYTRGNRYGTWESTQAQGNYTIPQPVLSVLPLNDPVADWVFAAKYLKSAEFLPRLTTKTMEGAHWPHLEHPQVFNGLLRAWLETLNHSFTPDQRVLSDEL